MNDDRLVQCQHCKEDDGGKDGEEKDSTFFHGIVTPAPIQKAWGIGRLITRPGGKRKRSLRTIWGAGFEAATSNLALGEYHSLAFIPAEDMPEWIEATFLDPFVAGFFWTMVENRRKGRRIIGQCEQGKPQDAMSKWARARAEMQVTQWFGFVLVEHELYSAARERDAFGAPTFCRGTGRSVFTIRGHDVEEFVGVVRRYGQMLPVSARS